jgi:hypothetical protein
MMLLPAIRTMAQLQSDLTGESPEYSEFTAGLSLLMSYGKQISYRQVLNNDIYGYKKTISIRNSTVKICQRLNNPDQPLNVTCYLLLKAFHLPAGRFPSPVYSIVNKPFTSGNQINQKEIMDRFDQNRKLKLSEFSGSQWMKNDGNIGLMTISHYIVGLNKPIRNLENKWIKEYSRIALGLFQLNRKH